MASRALREAGSEGALSARDPRAGSGPHHARGCRLRAPSSGPHPRPGNQPWLFSSLRIPPKAWPPSAGCRDHAMSKVREDTGEARLEAQTPRLSPPLSPW